MSWLGALAAKTENLLNKVDQVAGHALQNSSLEKSDSSSNLSQWQQPSSNDIQSVTTEATTYSPYLSRKSEKIINPISQSIKSSKSSNPKDPDNDLFEFLNSSPSQPPSSLTPALSSNKHSRNSSNASLKSSHDNIENAETFSVIQKVDDQQNKQLMDARSECNSSVALSDKHDQGDDKISSSSSSAIEVENQLLKSEIHSLNREMQSILSRIQTNQEELNRSNKMLEQQSRQMMKGEQIVRELQDRESDLMKALDAKDTQLSVLRVRLEEADSALQLHTKKIHDYQMEKENLLQDHSLSTGVQTHALDTLQEKLKEVEGMLKQESDRCSRIEEECREKVSKLESDKENLLSETSNLQRTLAREKANSVDMTNQLRNAKTQAETAKQELSQYKDKATRILQSKDRLIASLKETHHDRVDGSGASEPTIHATEMESLKQERDVLREDYNSCQLALENLRAELLEVESQLQEEVEATKDQMRMMEEQMDGEKKRREDAEADVGRCKQVGDVHYVDSSRTCPSHRHIKELRYLHEETLKQKTTFQMRLQDREAEIQRLRNLLTTKSLNATSQEELESRLHQLTESLIQKQTTVESLSTEKNSLLLQLERMEKQCREAESSAMRNSSTSVHLNSGPDDDEVRARYSTFMKESPFDGKVTRKVKMAANSIDRFSMRLGLFLRRYPIARVFIIIYMLILHLWVMVVMLTYKPEIHADDFAPGLPHSS